MNHADVDPSLCAAEPPQETLDDGFSPRAVEDGLANAEGRDPAPAEPALGAKSPF